MSRQPSLSPWEKVQVLHVHGALSGPLYSSSPTVQVIFFTSISLGRLSGPWKRTRTFKTL